MATNDKQAPKGTSDEAIGRPGPWREGRYQRAGKPVDDSVLTEPPLDAPPSDARPPKGKATEHPKSTAVHLDEYTTPGAGPAHPDQPDRS